MIPPCEHVRPLLDAYLANELQVESLQQVNAHLAQCADCRVALESRQRVRSILQTAVRGLVPPPDFALQVRQAVRAEAHARRHVPYVWLALAAAILLAAALAWQWRADSARILALLALGKGDHVFCARGEFYPDVPPTPDEMRDQVGPAYAALVDDVIRQTRGYRIREGHVCHWEEREFVHFILQREGKLTSFMLTRKKSPGEVFPRHALLAAMRADGIPVYTEQDDGMSIAGADTGQHLAFAISERNPEESARLMAALLPGIERVVESHR